MNFSGMESDVRGLFSASTLRNRTTSPVSPDFRSQHEFSIRDRGNISTMLRGSFQGMGAERGVALRRKTR
jgi:hypothetical protein